MISRNFCWEWSYVCKFNAPRLKDNSWKQFTIAQCGNYGNILSRIFGKNFTKATVLLKKCGESKFFIFPHYYTVLCMGRERKMKKISVRSKYSMYINYKKTAVGLAKVFLTKISWNQLLTKIAKDFASSSHRFHEMFVKRVRVEKWKILTEFFFVKSPTL